ncbi:glycoside hydrolase family 9 protein [Streptomyces dysideae]|uniref:Endoglucanase n=1 Tax=Streptomyces dysideae TaxID=909626 RepID=A0A101UPB5_9ACTN|nr:glycoside hydrolase family 9 protein [Streptomyces dysideae]KUO14425.1 endoglucanase [Streptomyces dysideae]
MARTIDRLSRGRGRRLGVLGVSGLLATAIAVPVVTNGMGVELGGSNAQTLIQGVKPSAPKTGPASAVRVNQVGYLTDGPKNGAFVTKAKEPLAWSLKDADGKEKATGTTTPAGLDSSSGEKVHTFDFSDVTDAGHGYTITIDGEKSEPFDIGDDLYTPLRSDALAYFYHNRSGVEIDSKLVGKEYARPAGHVNGAASSDEKVPCQPTVCDYTLDVSGGWYDAGDYGKYVVNGGIAAAQLMSTYERTQNAKGVQKASLNDGTLRVPEHGNNTPDALDEARWEMDFLLSMQVPQGEKLAGMAHHKVHDSTWGAIPLRADKSEGKRELHAPSTAATLNLAATAAQAARLFEPYDPEFAAKSLKAARAAYDAAKANPEMMADPGDATGGGAYSDYNVEDEFYWATSELFITTGEKGYHKDVLGSKLHGDADALFPRGGISWQSTAGLGALDLATVPNKLSDDKLAAVRKTVTKAADGYAADSKKAAYGVPYAPGDGRYAWGSNGQVMNNMVVLGTAHDLTGEDKYRDAVLRGMDYIMGGNPLSQSYVTGYGERYSHNQHHRFWAKQKDAKLPNPAPGALAGGPNSSLEDPVASAKLKGCAPAKCYMDDIESWSTNEITINWNAPLAWVASYVDDLGSGSKDKAQA